MSYKVRNIYGKIKNKSLEVSVPGSKSVTARSLLTAALADGESVLYGVQLSDDCLSFLNCLKDLGIDCNATCTTVKIRGCNKRLECRTAEIYVGSAGTAARFLPAFLAFQDGRFKLTCSDQMKRRPIAPLIKALEGLGAKFTFLENENSYPFIIEGTASPNARVGVDITESSQFLSALLISAVCADYPVSITTDGNHGLDYVRMTESIMRSFGAEVNESGGVYTVFGNYSAREYWVEPDISAACYFYAMNRLLGTDVKVCGVSPESMQGDYKFIRLIKDFDGGRVDMREFSDQALTLAAIAPYFSNATQICGVAHIRRQECDRIAAIVRNLTAMGVKCEERDDGVIIYPSSPKPASIDTFGDHRVAMSFALTGLRADGVEIENPRVCAKTFKEYFEVLDNICLNLTK